MLLEAIGNCEPTCLPFANSSLGNALGLLDTNNPGAVQDCSLHPGTWDTSNSRAVAFLPLPALVNTVNVHTDRSALWDRYLDLWLVVYIEPPKRSSAAMRCDPARRQAGGQQLHLPTLGHTRKSIDSRLNQHPPAEL